MNILKSNFATNDLGISRSGWILIFLTIALALSSCGFQLKQSASLPEAFGPVSVEGIGRFSSFYKSVRNALKQSSIKIVDAAEARNRLILSPGRERKVLSVNTSGKVSEYELIQSVNYRVVGSDGETLIKPTTIKTSAYYTVSNTDVLGDDQEEADLFRRLEQRLVNQMFTRISAGN